jgi:hypothetical protein
MIPMEFRICRSVPARRALQFRIQLEGIFDRSGDEVAKLQEIIERNVEFRSMPPIADPESHFSFAGRLNGSNVRR